jgi:hypothetical protein
LIKGSRCQDDCVSLVETVPDKPPLLTIFVADGAGSAKYGRKGAELAVGSVSRFVSESYAGTEFALNNQFAEECVKVVRENIFEEAQRNKAKARDYACTFLGVVASPFETLLMQIGDGGIVVDIGQGLEVPITPMTGEYANMTNFVTDENALDALKVWERPARVDRVAVFSDGVQRLALNMANNTAHSPFFTPFFEILSKATEEQEERLQVELARFLQSQGVNERTDDDKTLALAYWVGEP